MKRVGFIYPKICDKENIRLAIKKASIRKKKYSVVKAVLNNTEYYVNRIQSLLITESFKNSKYEELTIYEALSKKTRLIHKPPFYPDQIIHWCLMLQIQPILNRGMDPYCSGNVPGRGEQHIRKFLRRKLIEDPKGTKYYLKYDIRHYYQSIDHNRLITKIKRLIKDKATLNLIQEIINATDKGLPIGTYPSQWFANLYLQDHDHYLREKLKVKDMVRYVDDILILGPNKRKLRKIKNEIEAYLNNVEKLEIKPNWVIREVAKHPIDIIGYKFYRNGKLSIRSRIWKNARRSMLSIS